MTTTIPEPSHVKRDPGQLVEMAWDPITRIVGSLGIYTKIDFDNREVVECHSTSSIFRGYSLFMKGKDPRDAHFITSRICGICGDNHCTCSVYTQNMAYGVRPPHLGEWLINLGEAAEYMFDHNIFQENLVGVDYCEKMVSETNPSVLAKAENTQAPQAGAHGYRTIADIMRALNPFTGDFYREALQVSRWTREMFCLMEGRHVHPVDAVSRRNRHHRNGSVDDRLHDPADALRRVHEEGRADARRPVRLLLRGAAGLRPGRVCGAPCSAAGARSRIPSTATSPTRTWRTGAARCSSRRASSSTASSSRRHWSTSTSASESSWAVRITTIGPTRRCSSRPIRWATRLIGGIRGTSTPTRSPQKRDLEDKYSWVMSPRWFDGKDHLALDTGGGPLARLWATALAGLVDIGYVKSTGHSVQINFPKTALKGPVSFEWKIPQYGSNTIERNRARTYFQAYAAACALHFAEKALVEIRAGRTKTWEKFEVPDEGIGCGFTEAVRGVLSHHMVIRDGKIANYHPYPPTPWNASPRDSYGTPGPYEDAVQGQPIFEENDREHFKGIDIMRTVRSFDPCLPCGVHMYLGKGKTLDLLHSPTQSATGE